MEGLVIDGAEVAERIACIFDEQHDSIASMSWFDESTKDVFRALIEASDPREATVDGDTVRIPCTYKVGADDEPECGNVVVPTAWFDMAVSQALSAEMARRLGVSEGEAMDSIKELRQFGILRFWDTDSRPASTCAARSPRRWKKRKRR